MTTSTWSRCLHLLLLVEAKWPPWDLQSVCCAILETIWHWQVSDHSQSDNQRQTLRMTTVYWMDDNVELNLTFFFFFSDPFISWWMTLGWFFRCCFTICLNILHWEEVGTSYQVERPYVFFIDPCPVQENHPGWVAEATSGFLEGCLSVESNTNLISGSYDSVINLIHWHLSLPWVTIYVFIE